jgi:mannitol/fructose-specific phosphotransferase system IIA component (Ntr-type)
MKLSKFCEEELMSFDLASIAKEDIIKELVELAAKSSMVRDKEELMAAVLEREKLVTTGVGYGVAFPHAKTRAIKGITIAFGRSEVGVEFEAMDKKPVHLFS